MVSETEMAESSSEVSSVIRHGPGDGVLKLNVGGKEFMTLRSTVESNPVLGEYIHRAEANGEILRDGGKSVFIDRDPQHFGLILAHLRNKAEGISYNAHQAIGGIKLHKKPKYIRLPKDNPGALEDLYVEAQHYKMEDLQYHLCSTGIMTRVFSFFGGGGTNPFEAASNFVKQARRSAITLLGTGSIIGAMQQEMDWLGINIKLPTFNKKDGSDEKKKKATDNEPSIA
jgi:hypothetical protein